MVPKTTTTATLARLSRDGWGLPADLSKAQWDEYGRQLAEANGHLQWLWGEWWLHGVHAYGESEAQAALLGISLPTVRNYAWVFEKVESSARREHLTWSHHAAVAPLAADQQTEYLAAAEYGNWTVRQLQNHIREHANGEDRPPKKPRRTKPKPPPDPDSSAVIETTAEEKNPDPEPEANNQTDDPAVSPEELALISDQARLIRAVADWASRGGVSFHDAVDKLIARLVVPPPENPPPKKKASRKAAKKPTAKPTPSGREVRTYFKKGNVE